MNKDLQVLVQNTKTGEIYETEEYFSVLGGFNVYEPSVKVKKEYRENLRNQQALTRELGGFVKVLYYNNEILYGNELGLSKATVTRLLTLSTYLDYDNCLVLEIPKTKKQAQEVEYMKRKDIQEVLGLSKNAFDTFMKEITKANILIKEDKKYKLSSDYFYRGETSKDIYFSRMYIDTVRELYVNTSTRKHSTLSYIFQLMPFVHWKTNILVKDRMSNIENMEHLNMYDICELLGLETSKTSINNMKKELLSFRVVRDGKELYLFNYLKVGGAKGSKESFVINPLVYNAMSDFNDFKQVMVNMWVD